MTILADENSSVIVQGITGDIGSVQTKLMLEYGTRIVAGVTPGKGGQSIHDIPVYNTVKETLLEHEAEASILFMPASRVLNAAKEAIDAGIGMLVIITEHVPVHDTLKVKAEAQKQGVTVLGPNTPGVISPGKTKIGILPGNLYRPGNVGIVSRSATLAYEIAGNLTEAGIGQSTCAGIGGDRVTGVTFVDLLKLFDKDDETSIVVLIGEVGRTVEEEAADYIGKEFSKPVVAYVVGRTVPPEKKMGHAGAIIERGRGTAESKIEAFRRAGVSVITRPSEVVSCVEEALKERR
jgi:succinyl-CoA synthetase alpha subunit